MCNGPGTHTGHILKVSSVLFVMKGQNVVAVSINLIYVQFTAADMQLRDSCDHFHIMKLQHCYTVTNIRRPKTIPPAT